MKQLSRADLRGYQNRIIDHIKDNLNCAAWVDMGLGKTVATLTALKDLMESFDVDKVLIIAPLRVARKTWDDEIAEWAHLEGLRTAHVIGTAAQRLDALKRTDVDIHLINRENVDWLKNQFVTGTGKKMKLIRRWPWDTVVIDESSSFKSADSIRFKALRSLRPCYERLIQLTGTPAPNGYEDLWSQINLLDRGKRLGFTKKAFRARWMDAPDRWNPNDTKYVMKDHSAGQIQEAVKDVVISMRAEEYLDLPPVMYNPVYVHLDDKQKDMYRQMQRKFVLELKGKKITAVNAGVLTGKLLQLANGNIYTGAGKEFEFFHGEKHAALIELLDNAKGPAMVTAWFKPDVAEVKGLVDQWCWDNGRKKWEVLSDEASENRWNTGQTDVLVIHPASAGHGLNLHKNDCETIIWYGLTWSLELYQQMNARIAGGHRRVGKNVIIHHILTKDTIDEYVFDVIGKKGVTQQNLLESVKAVVDAEEL